MGEYDLQGACLAALPAPAVRGLEHFNAGKYFEAHEFLETAWRAEAGAVRELYRGVLQVAVAYYHLRRGNRVGALKLFAHARQWLAPFRPTCQGIQVERLLQDVDAVEAEVRRLGPESTALVDQAFFHPVEYQILQ